MSNKHIAKKEKIKVVNKISGNRYWILSHKFNPMKYEQYEPKPIELLPDTLTLTCKECGNQQTYCNKYSYRRAMGIGSDQTQKNKGLCGKCSYKRKRQPHGPRTKEQVERMRLSQIQNLGYDTIKEYEKDNMNKKKYYEKVDEFSRTNLRREKPDLYKLWSENKWDGTDMNKLTIEHIKPKSVCYELGITIEEASDISNLEIITMKENMERWRDFEHSKKVKQKLIGRRKYQERIESGDDWAWNKTYHKDIQV